MPLSPAVKRARKAAKARAAKADRAHDAEVRKLERAAGLLMPAEQARRGVMQWIEWSGPAGNEPMLREVEVA